MLPLNNQLAEICGIHSGDGYLRGEGKRWELDISGNVEEKNYYDYNVKLLFESFFKIKINCRIFNSRNTYGFVIRDREIIKFVHNLGFPYGNKSTTVKVPNFILNSNNKEIIKSFIRGLFDTDGCISFRKRTQGKYSEFKRVHHYYPVIKFSSVSKQLIQNLTILLQKLEYDKIKFYIYKPKKKTENLRYIIVLYGDDKSNKFLKEIKPKNPVKLSRFLLWKKIGFCPANLTYNQRLEMLKNHSK
jgi:intein/homing endonuclease